MEDKKMTNQMEKRKTIDKIIEGFGDVLIEHLMPLLPVYGSLLLGTQIAPCIKSGDYGYAATSAFMSGLLLAPYFKLWAKNKKKDLEYHASDK